LVAEGAAFRHYSCSTVELRWLERLSILAFLRLDTVQH